MDPYAVNSEVELQRSGPRAVEAWKLWVAGLSVLLSALPYALIMLAVPGFRGLYAGFGADLPWLTSLVINAGPYALALLPLGLIPAISLWRERATGGAHGSKRLAWVIGSMVFAWLILVAAWIGFYMPIFKLGAVV